jgi:hypothetical protein
MDGKKPQAPPAEVKEFLAEPAVARAGISVSDLTDRAA